MGVVAYRPSEKDGSIDKTKRLRLSQIRHQARIKNCLPVPRTLRECKGVQREQRKSRLTQIRHQARSKIHVLSLSQVETGGCPNGNLIKGLTNLTEVRNQAHSPLNSTENTMDLQERNGEHVESNLDRYVCEGKQVIHS